MFGGVYCAGKVESSRIEDLNGRSRHVEPHAFAVENDRRVIDLYGVEDSPFLVDFEEAEDVLVDFDGAEEGSR